MREVEVNVAYRWFLGCATGSGCFDPEPEPSSSLFREQGGLVPNIAEVTLVCLCPKDGAIEMQLRARRSIPTCLARCGCRSTEALHWLADACPGWPCRSATGTPAPDFWRADRLFRARYTFTVMDLHHLLQIHRRVKSSREPHHN
jgi:hypothetical protein